jgi:hypothetical protein
VPKAKEEKKRKRRPGAGRKPLGKGRYLFKLYPSTHELIKEGAALAGISKSEFVERAILKTKSKGQRT